MQRTSVRKESDRAETRPADESLVRNEILNSIPESEFNLIRPELEPVELPQRLILHEPGERILYAYFLNQGLASLVVITSDGRSVEIAIVGHEGLVGTPLAVGLHRGPYRSIMQIPGNGFRIKAESLEQVLHETPQLRLLLNQYVLTQGLQIAQIAACNRLHEIEQRLARWLLMGQDRVESDALPITHEFLALMLGVRRAGVTTALQSLEGLEVIKASRGRIDILDRDELIKCAGGSYGVAEAEYERLIA